MIDGQTNIKKSLKPKLSTRQRNLLYAVVKEYCEFGNAVSSKVLKDKYGFEISPATIRNEFSKLRDLGYLYQPFTNSSSQPTESAFKLFINQLIQGIHTSGHNQKMLKSQIDKLQKKQENLQKEITKLLAFETSSVGFAVNMEEENVFGLKNLLTSPNEGHITDLLDFLENLDQHKKFLLGSEETAGEGNPLTTMFGSDNPVFPMGKGFAMVSAKAKVNNQDTVFGIITQPHLLGREKTIQILNSIKDILNNN